LESTRRRMIAVAVTVCGFAVGMAGLLNYFKYRSTAHRVVTERLIVTGKAVENSIQSALALGLQFSELGTLEGMLERERLTDPLIVGIDVFDNTGRPMYTTDRLRAEKPAPELWVQNARKPGNPSWNTEIDGESAAGMALKSNLDLPIGFLAIRYAGDRVRETTYGVGRELAVTSLLTFAVAALLSSLGVAWVTRGLARDMKSVEAALRAASAQETPPAALDQNSSDPALATHSGPSLDAANRVRGDLGRALRRFLRTTMGAQKRVAAVRATLHQGFER
jgi:hypothetical protein